MAERISEKHFFELDYTQWDPQLGEWSVILRSLNPTSASAPKIIEEAVISQYCIHCPMYQNCGPIAGLREARDGSKFPTVAGGKPYMIDSKKCFLNNITITLDLPTR